MRARWLGLLALVAAVAAAGGAVAADLPYIISSGEATLIEPLPFDHAAHEDSLGDARVACSDCHPVGLALPAQEGTRAPEQALPPPVSTCHGCHLAEARRAPRAAPTACASCHADMLQLVPDNHGPGWLERHAADARAFGADCSSCHKTSECFDCHADRGPLTVDPHGPGFAAMHGVEARVDPRSCSTCHAASSCVACHEGSVSPW